MTPAEQQAFITAYGRCVAAVPDDKVAEFVSRFVAGEDMDYSGDYTSIMDALLMWCDAIRWQMEQEVAA